MGLVKLLKNLEHNDNWIQIQPIWTYFNLLQETNGAMGL